MESHEIEGKNYTLNPFTNNPWKEGEWENFDLLKFKALSALDAQSENAEE